MSLRFVMRFFIVTSPEVIFSILLLIEVPVMIYACNLFSCHTFIWFVSYQSRKYILKVELNNVNINFREISNIYAWTGVSLYHLRFDWCQLIPSTSGLVSIDIIYAWTGVSLHHLHFALVSVCIVDVWLVSVDTVCVWFGFCLKGLRLHWCQTISVTFALAILIVK